MDEDYLTRAHDASSNHRDLVARSQSCACFFCLRTFSPSQIVEWVEDVSGTAVCPYCGIDSVIPDAAGFQFTPEFLEAMQVFWFS